MLSTFKTEFKIKNADTVNRIIYSIKKLKFIGDRIADDWYVRADVKGVLNIFALLRRFLGNTFSKFIYMFFVLVTPCGFFMELIEEAQGESVVDLMDVIVWAFFCMNCLLGSFVASKIFSNDEKDYLFLELLRMNPKKHFVSKCFTNALSQIVYYGIFLFIITIVISDWSILQYLSLLLVYTGFRFIGEAVKLKLNDKFGIPFTEKNIVVAGRYYLYCIVITLLAYGLMVVPYIVSRLVDGVSYTSFYQLAEQADNVVTSLPIVIVSLFLGAVSIRYIVKYDRYRTIGKKTANYNIVNEKADVMKNTTLKQAEIKDKDITEEECKAHLYEEKEGYEYLNALFFERHKSLVKKPVRIKVLILAAVMVILMVTLIVLNIFMGEKKFEEISFLIWEVISSVFPIFVFFMYCASSGKSLTTAMFYNCDYSLLKYGYYRKADAILLNFRIRLRYMIKMEMPMVGVISLGMIVNTLLLHRLDKWLELLAIIVCIALLAVFFEVVYLCMYYIFQPYTEGGSVTGFGYKLCTGIIYIAAYSCMQIHTNPIYFSIGVLIVTVIGLVVSYLVAYKVAPKYFVLK